MDWMMLLGTLIVIIIGVVVGGWLVSWNHSRREKKHRKEETGKQLQQPATKGKEGDGKPAGS